MTKPMGVSEYKIKDYLPENLQNELPSIEELITIVKKRSVISFEDTRERPVET